jgi:hypothetical protein
MRFGNKSSRNKICQARLTRRRKVVVQTLEYVNGERKTVDSNRVWKSQAALTNRRKLLDKIHGWYDKEAKKIDTVLARLDEPARPVAKPPRAKYDRLTP